MKEYIDKTAVKAEIEKRIASLESIGSENYLHDNYPEQYAMLVTLKSLKFSLDTLEVKEVEEKFEHPNIKVKDSVEVSSRMPHIDKRLLPIAEFIMDYASWNLHKDEWNQPVLEVPLFRVLDALVQKGKPYCEG